MPPVTSCDDPARVLSVCSLAAALDERSSFGPLSLLLPVNDASPPLFSGTRGGRFLDLIGSMDFCAPSCDYTISIQGVQ